LRRAVFLLTIKQYESAGRLFSRRFRLCTPVGAGATGIIHRTSGVPPSTRTVFFAILQRKDGGDGIGATMEDQETLRQKLAELRTEHRDLDDVIARLIEQGPVNQLQMQRLKKRKLALKDAISRLESCLLPDIIA
jgi:hypothetical protein